MGKVVVPAPTTSTRQVVLPMESQLMNSIVLREMLRDRQIITLVSMQANNHQEDY